MSSVPDIILLQSKKIVVSMTREIARYQRKEMNNTLGRHLGHPG